MWTGVQRTWIAAGACAVGLSIGNAWAQPAAPPPPPPPPRAEPAGALAQVFALSGGSYLGVGVREVDAERSKEIKLKETYGVEITAVDEDSPAAKAGLKTGDVVLEYQGQRVEGTAQFVRLVRETPPERAVKMVVWRGGSTQTLTATIGTRKARAMVGRVGPEFEDFTVRVPKVDIVIPDIPKAMMSWRSSMLGVEAESLKDSQLAAYFGVKDGVLVRSVIKGTAAEKAGIKAGDVLLKVDEEKVESPRDVTSAIRKARSASKKGVPITLMRDRKEMNLTVSIEDDQQGLRYTSPSRRVTVRQEEL
jgi:serine protease Do